MPVCAFVIDEEKTTRTTALGALVVPWSDVASVHPYRCVAGKDAATLAALIESRHL